MSISRYFVNVVSISYRYRIESEKVISKHHYHAPVRRRFGHPALQPQQLQAINCLYTSRRDIGRCSLVARFDISIHRSQFDWPPPASVKYCGSRPRSNWSLSRVDRLRCFDGRLGLDRLLRLLDHNSTRSILVATLGGRLERADSLAVWPDITPRT